MLMQNKDKIDELVRVSSALGVLKWIKQGTFTHFKLAYHPLTTTKQYYNYLGELTIFWHKIIFKASQDYQFIINLFTPLAQKDDMIKGLLNIFKKRGKAKKDGICLTRIDYYNNQQNQPKITQFNLLAVGMQSNMQRFQQAKQLCQNNDESYMKSRTIYNFSQSIRELVNICHIQGIILFVIYSYQANFLDQARFEIELKKQKFIVLRVTLKQMYNNITLKQNNDLYYENQRVAAVYYRSAYRLQHFIFGQNYDINHSWQVQQKIQFSNAISIPPVQYRLLNQKRFQTQIGKLQILKKYATQEEIIALMKTRVQQWEFDTITHEQLQELIAKVEVNPDNYILKPNMEGGGNNFFGAESLHKLKTLSRQQLKSFILMQKIKTKSIENLMIQGQKSYIQQCQYEISRYGTLSWANNEIIRNKADGFLIRAKPPHENEGGIMTGIGAIVTWKTI